MFTHPIQPSTPTPVPPDLLHSSICGKGTGCNAAKEMWPAKIKDAMIQ